MIPLLLTGCITPQGKAVKSLVLSTGASVAKESYEDAKFVLCQATPIGIIEDNFRDKPGLRIAYKKTCGHSID